MQTLRRLTRQNLIQAEQTQQWIVHINKLNKPLQKEIRYSSFLLLLLFNWVVYLFMWRLPKCCMHGLHHFLCRFLKRGTCCHQLLTAKEVTDKKRDTDFLLQGLLFSQQQQQNSQELSINYVNLFKGRGVKNSGKK